MDLVTEQLQESALTAIKAADDAVTDYMDDAAVALVGLAFGLALSPGGSPGDRSSRRSSHAP
jgi:hypothetical protein